MELNHNEAFLNQYAAIHQQFIRFCSSKAIGWMETEDLYKELQKDIYTILSRTTGKDYQQIAKDSDRDKWMRAEEALTYGLIDEVLNRGILT